MPYISRQAWARRGMDEGTRISSAVVTDIQVTFRQETSVCVVRTSRENYCLRRFHRKLSKECLQIFTDGSFMSDSSNTSAGIFSEIFSFYVPVGRGTAFDDVIAAIRTALSQLHCYLEKFTRAVILSGSRAALLAVVSDNNPIT
ncbi:hypothetical protein TNCV_27831 [Trichonephila clavipes]|uniref:Uncharacterized protein n=1 Tax=Trichonephila clavipes TaxID=2585209 RepID=A0A8X6WK50_TRICX|nr:hypothetical protein TNCV_27831 [Trichonephila clavipes]